MNTRVSDVRAFVIACLVFAIILVMQNYAFRDQFAKLLEQQREEIVVRADKVATAIISEQTQRLVGFAELLIEGETIPLFMSSSNPDVIGRVNERLSKFIVNTEAQNVFLFGKNGASLSSIEVPAKVAELKNEVAISKSPKSVVLCESNNCVHFVAIPVLYRGADVGVIVTAHGLKEAFLSFEKATGLAISIGLCQGAGIQENKDSLLSVNLLQASLNLPTGFCFRALLDVVHENEALVGLVKFNAIISAIGSISLASALLLLYFIGMRSHRKVFRNEVAAKEEKSVVLDRVSRDFEKERRLLAAELHDELGQRLVPIRFKVSILRSLAREKGHEDLIEIACSIESDIKSMSEGVSALINSLRPPLLDTMGLKGSIETMVHEFHDVMPNCDFKLFFDGRMDIDDINDPTQVTIYRVIQEGLTNISKHAPEATIVNISIYCSDGGLGIGISDNGPGMTDKETGGIGLAGMKARAFALNGQLLISSNVCEGCADAGTSLLFTLPCGAVPFCGKSCHKV